MALATSSGVANRDIGTWLMMSSIRVGATGLVLVVHFGFYPPGAYGIYPYSRPPHSAARVEVRPIRPCLEAL